MTDLVCCLSTGKGTWGEVSRLIQQYHWRNIFLITNSFGKEKFTLQRPANYIVLDLNADPLTLSKEIDTALRGKLSGDVAINFSSGTGSEHMALLAALIRQGVGLRMVLPGEKDLVELQ